MMHFTHYENEVTCPSGLTVVRREGQCFRSLGRWDDRRGKNRKWMKPRRLSLVCLYEGLSLPAVFPKEFSGFKILFLHVLQMYTAIEHIGWIDSIILNHMRFFIHNEMRVGS